MTKLLERALEAVRGLSEDAQDDIARIVLQFAGSDEAPMIKLTAEERAAIDASKVAAERGDFATDDEVRAVWRRHGL